MTANRRKVAGTMAYHAGHAAEARIALDYERRGYRVARHRWRGKSGEIDLILRDGEGLIFVEVKQSRDFDRALERITPRQIARIHAAAEEFAGSEPRGLLTDMRFDVAMVDQSGAVRVMENALWL